MSTTIRVGPVLPPVVDDAVFQVKAEQNGGIPIAAVSPPQQLVANVLNPAAGSVLARDTTSIPGVSMFARQWYPPLFYKHDDLVVSKEVFFEALNKFHSVLGTRLTKKGRKGKERAAEVKSFQESINSIPPLGGIAIELHRLYVEVTARGGLEKVIKDRKWREVTNLFKFPDTITSASYMLRKYYVGLLYYFEQAYFFGKQGPLVPPPIWMPGPIKKSAQAAARTYAMQEGDLSNMRKRKILPLQKVPVLDPAQSIGHVERGRIEGKFDQGYLVTVTVGSEKLQGVLYHVPPTHRAPQHATVPTYEDTIGAEVRIPRGEPKAGGSWRKRPRKEEMLKKDPNAPRPNRTGYNFFFAEQVSIFKAMFPDKDKDLSKMIGDAWNRLTEEEKLPFQDRGVKDKERYTRELREYRERLRLQEAGYPMEVATQHVREQDKVEASVDVVADPATDSISNTDTDPVSTSATEGSHDCHVNVKLEPTPEVKLQQPESTPVEAPRLEKEEVSSHNIRESSSPVSPKKEKV